MNENYEDLDKLILTTKDRDLFLEDLETLLENLFETQEPLLEKVKRYVSSRYGDFFSNFFEKFQLQNHQTPLAEKSLKDLKQYALDIPVVDIRISFRPKDIDVRDISTWIDGALKKKVLLHVSVDPALIGGATVKYKGKYRDFSLLSKLESYGRVQ